jgi:DNA-binding CsgD family transcriptional regulator
LSISAIERSRFTAALDLLRCSVLLTDANGGIVYMNRSAADMLNAGEAVRSRHNIVRAARPSAGHELNEALKHAARADARIGKTGLTVKLSDDGALPVVAHVLPLAGTQFPGDLESSAVAAIFIRNQEDISDSAGLLATTYQLTPAEARVLCCLLAGRSLSQAAADLRVAHSTVKTHLNVIFRKTGARRQSDLILLASQLSAPVFAG